MRSAGDETPASRYRSRLKYMMKGPVEKGTPYCLPPWRHGSCRSGAGSSRSYPSVAESVGRASSRAPASRYSRRGSTGSEVRSGARAEERRVGNAWGGAARAGEGEEVGGDGD